MKIPLLLLFAITALSIPHPINPPSATIPIAEAEWSFLPPATLPHDVPDPSFIIPSIFSIIPHDSTTQDDVPTVTKTFVETVTERITETVTLTSSEDITETRSLPRKTVTKTASFSGGVFVESTTTSFETSTTTGVMDPFRGHGQPIWPGQEDNDDRVILP